MFTTTIHEETTLCYDRQSEHFHHTRNNHKRPELSYIDQVLNNMPSNMNIIDLWCGTWRIAGWLDEKNISCTYVWVDASSGMISKAQEMYPDHNFLVSPMNDYLKKIKQQSVDVCILLASFHHLASQQKRLMVLNNLYRALTYGGQVILFNRSYSDRFIKRYRKLMAASVGKSLITLWKYNMHDLHIPWKDPKRQQNNITHKRFYHMFTLQELTNLVALTDFDIQTLWYISQDWTLTNKRKTSRNSIMILEKWY